MPIDIQKLSDTTFGVRLAQTLGRILPPKPGYRFAEFIGEQVASRPGSKMVKAIRANQWVVHGETLDGAELDKFVHETFRRSARFHFDFYHFINDRAAAGRMIVPDPAIEKVLMRSEFEDRGLMIATLHQGSFDLGLQWLVQNGLKSLILTIPDPQGGRRAEFETRRNMGATILPVSLVSIRQALRHLHQGGLVLTGIDRPVPQPEMMPLFFGRRAALPIHHIFLAIKTRVPIMIMVMHLQPDGKYRISSSEPIEMDQYPDRETETLRNAEKVLNIAETFIRQAPTQWIVPLPVWPDILEQDLPA